MKTLLLFLAIIFSRSINTQLNYQNAVFHTSLQGAVPEVIYSGEYNANAFFIRNINSISYDSFAELVTLNPLNGNIINSNTFSIAGLLINSVVKSNQMLYMTATMNNDSLCIMKYNLSSNIMVWSKTLPTWPNIEKKYIAYDGSKNLYLFGDYFSSGPVGPMLTKIDTNGVLIWNKKLSNYYEHPLGIICNGPRQVYLANGGGDSFSFTSSIIKLDSSGSVLSTQTKSATTSMNFSKGFITLFNGHIVSVNRMYNGIAAVGGPAIINMMDTSLNIINTRILPVNQIFVGSVYANQNNLLLSGGRRSIRYDTLLNIVGSNYFNKNPVYTCSSFIHSSNSSMHFFNPNSSDTVFAIKTDMYEKVGCRDSVSNISAGTFTYVTANLTFTTTSVINPNSSNITLINPNSSNITLTVAPIAFSSTQICTSLTANIETVADTDIISVFPNPVNSVLTISSENAFSKFIIKDVAGKNINSREMSKSFDVSDLKPGIYFISLYENEKLISVKKIVKTAQE